MMLPLVVAPVLVSTGAIGSFDHAAHYLPPRATQLARQQKLPEPQAGSKTLI